MLPLSNAIPFYIAAATSGGQSVDIGRGQIGLASVPIFVPAGFNGSSVVVFDPSYATFTGPDGPLPFVPGDAGGIVALPEPSTPALVAAWPGQCIAAGVAARCVVGQGTG